MTSGSLAQPTSGGVRRGVPAPATRPTRSRVDHSTARGLLDTALPRVVVVHRYAWTREVLRSSWESGRRAIVVAEARDGAEGLAVAVAEQPDIVFLQQRLPYLDGISVAQQLCRLVPHAVVGVQTESLGDVVAALEAGAQWAGTGPVPAATVAAELLRLAGAPHDLFAN